MVENRIAQNFGAWGLLKYALPTVCMMLFTSIYTMVDGVFVAQFVSVDALSALNIVNPLFSLVMGFGVMLGAGGSAVIAKNIGEGEEQQAFDNLSTLVFFGTILGLVLMVLLLVFMDLEFAWCNRDTDAVLQGVLLLHRWILGTLGARAHVLELFHHGRKASDRSYRNALFWCIQHRWGLRSYRGGGNGDQGSSACDRACDLHSCGDRAHLLLQ